MSPPSMHGCKGWTAEQFPQSLCAPINRDSPLQPSSRQMEESPEEKESARSCGWAVEGRKLSRGIAATSSPAPEHSRVSQQGWPGVPTWKPPGQRQGGSGCDGGGLLLKGHTAQHGAYLTQTHSSRSSTSRHPRLPFTPQAL